MNILLWTLQVLLALHTFVGAVWKASNSEQIVPELQALPHGVWVTLIVVELLCSLGLILPAFFTRSVRQLVPIAAVCVAAEMLLFCALYKFSGSQEINHLTYWLVVAAVGAFVAYGRWALRPL